MIKLDSPERHIVLYTKGKYKKIDLIGDLKRIIGASIALGVEHVDINGVYYWVAKTYFKIFTKQTIRYHFAEELFKFDNIHTQETFIKFMCGKISVVQVKDIEKDNIILDLGEPDYSILPKKE